jgi:DNA-binding response OmpR family regulator
MTPTILVVDDDRDILDFLTYTLEKEHYHVISAANGNDAIEKAQLVPNVILLDVMLPGKDGWEVARTLKLNKETARIPIVFLSARNREIDQIIGLDLGADDYINKPVSITLLLARIRTVLKRASAAHEPIDNRHLHIQNLTIDTANYSVHLDEREVAFAKKEFELLVYLARNQNSVITREALASQVWGADVPAFSRTIDVHIRRIREKLGASGSLIETIKGVGYRLRN